MLLKCRENEYQKQHQRDFFGLNNRKGRRTSAHFLFMRPTRRGCLLIGRGSLGRGGHGGVARGAGGRAEPVLQQRRSDVALSLCTAVRLVLNNSRTRNQSHKPASSARDKDTGDGGRGGLLTSVCWSSSTSSRVRAASCLDLCSRRLTYRMGLDKASITSREDTWRGRQMCQLCFRGSRWKRNYNTTYLAFSSEMGHSAL